MGQKLHKYTTTLLLAYLLGYCMAYSEPVEAGSLNSNTPQIFQAQMAANKQHIRQLEDDRVSLFVFWMGMDTWSSILSWVFPSARYIAFLLLIIGCLVSSQTSNLAWHRLMRYTAFIYGTTYFYWNLLTVHEPNLEKKHLALDRSDFQDLYWKYYQKSEGYLFKGERKNFFTNITVSVDQQSIFIPDPLDDRFYEWVIYIVIFAIGVAGHQGLTVLKPWVAGHKLSILRIAFCLGIAPGIIGNGIISSVTYWYWSGKLNSAKLGKDVYAGSLALWVCISIILLVDFYLLIRHAMVDTKSEVWQQLSTARSKLRPCLLLETHIYNDSAHFRNLIGDISLFFVNKPYKQLGFSSKVCTWLGYLRWITAIVLPVSMMFQSRVIFVSVSLGLSFLVALLTILSFTDRHWFHSLVLLLTEVFAFIWILSSLLLVIDRYQNSSFLSSGAGKVFVWLQYVFWVLNHILELMIAVICLFPVTRAVDEYQTMAKNLENDQELTSNRQLDITSVEQISIIPKQPRVELIDDFPETHSENELDRKIQMHTFTKDTISFKRVFEGQNVRLISISDARISQRQEIKPEAEAKDSLGENKQKAGLLPSKETVSRPQEVKLTIKN